MSVANKISHAHLHAYELHLSAADIDPHATVSEPFPSNIEEPLSMMDACPILQARSYRPQECQSASSTILGCARRFNHN